MILYRDEDRSLTTIPIRFDRVDHDHLITDQVGTEPKPVIQSVPSRLPGWCSGVWRVSPYQSR